MARVYFERIIPGPYQLWVTDGTVQGTHRVGDLTNADDLVNVNGTLMLAATDQNGEGLWMVDGDTPTRVSNVVMNALPTNVDGTLFFRGIQSNEGFALWTSDGTPEGTVRLSGIQPRAGGARPDSMSGSLFIASSDPATGLELWTSDGTSAGTVLVRDIRPGSNSFGSDPYLLSEINGTWFFWANDGVHGSELWKTDGTNAGTMMVEDIWPGASPSGPYVTSGVIDGALIFIANDGVHGNALWRSDGTAAGTAMIVDIYPGALGDVTGRLATAGDLVFFLGTDGVHGSELWRTDGTANGTFMVADVNPSTATQEFPGPVVAVGNLVFFWQDDGIHGVELWKSDGTEVGTAMVADFTQGPASSLPFGFDSYAVADGELYFPVAPAQGSSGIGNLWKTDGTPEGTILLSNSVAFNAEIVAVENDGIHGGPGTDDLNGTEAGETLEGKAGNDHLTARGGNDLLDGGKGADVMAGGTGDDTYLVDGSDTVTEQPGEGADEVRTALPVYTLPQNVENLTFVGLGAFSGTGNSSNNVIIGGSGADVLDGGIGNDDLRGGSGSDLYYVHDSGDVITENPGAELDYVIAYATYTLPANVEAIYAMDGAGATGNGDSNLIFGAYAQHGLVLDGAGGSDIIYGTLFADTLIGGPGADALYGLDGDDTMQGGTGDDTFYVDQAGDVVQENPGEGDDKVYAQVNHTLAPNVEVLWTYGAATSGTGNGDANALLGVSSLHGLTLDGAGGNDTVYGSHFNDTLLGGEADDVLWGYGGDDTMRGGVGNDVYLVADAGDVVEENPGEGGDIIYASVNITLPDTVEHLFVHGAATTGTGNAGDNYIVNAFISTGVTLTGGGGNDVFVLVPGMANGVTITDFAGNGAGGGDILQFAAYGPGATFTNINATQWQVNYGAGLSQHDVIAFSNGAPIDPGDFLFV